MIISNLFKAYDTYSQTLLILRASLVPMFGFGENELYAQVANPPGSWVRAVEEFFMKYTGIPSLVFTGRGFFQYSFGIVPRRRPITVVGECWAMFAFQIVEMLNNFSRVVASTKKHSYDDRHSMSDFQVIDTSVLSINRENFC